MEEEIGLTDEVAPFTERGGLDVCVDALVGRFARNPNYKDKNMRTLNDHKVNPANDTLTVSVLDEPGAGGACHEYEVSHSDMAPTRISFRNGPINVDGNGVNGLTHEVLMAIVANRLRSFQAGPYSCKANACALTHIEEAQHWLQQRTLERMRRGVEGTHTV